MWRYVTIQPKDLVLDFIGRLITVSVAAFPFIWYHLGAPFAGDKLFAAIMAVIYTTTMLFGLYLSAKCVHRLLSFYYSAVNGKFGGLLKLTLFIFYMLVPVLELRFLLNRDDEAYVPAFLQPAVNDNDAIFVSVHCFLYGVPELNSALLADAIRKQQRYFAGVDDSFDPSVVIATPIGDMLALLKTDRIYLYSVFQPPSNYTPAATPGWRIERSADGTDSAWVYEHMYNLLFDDEESIAIALANAIDTLLEELQPYYAEEDYNE